MTGLDDGGSSDEHDFGSSGPEPTWSVTELHAAVNGLLVHVFGEQLWIEGEIRNLKRQDRGHVYFDLVDPDDERDSARPMMSVTLFASNRQQVNDHLRQVGGAVRMSDGVRVRIRGRLNVYSARSSLQIIMSGIDASFTLGVLSRERDRVMALLAAENLLTMNSSLTMVDVPMNVAIVTSLNSAAHHDALDELRRSGFGFRVSVFDARTQGADSPRSIVAAINAASHADNDVVLLVRGGGARTDLAAFDSEEVARAVARCPVPVITGIGHEIDRTIADEVSHRAHKTPTAAAAAMVDRVSVTARALATVSSQIPSATQGHLKRAELRLSNAAHSAGRSASHQLNAARREVDRLALALVRAAPLAVDSTCARMDDLAARVGPAGRQRLLRSAETVDALAARARTHDPRFALARGWSITRGPNGEVLRSVDLLSPGDVISTTVSGGTFRSVVVDDQTPGAGPGDEVAFRTNWSDDTDQGSVMLHGDVMVHGGDPVPADETDRGNDR